MTRYSPEFKESVVRKMMPPENMPIMRLAEEIDMTEFERLRAALNEEGGAKITALPLMIAAVCRTLPDYPQLNAHYYDDKDVVRRFGAVHMGVATQTNAGLMVPVLRHAESLDLWACAAGIARVAEGAKSGKLGRDELSGSTITLTSLGALGGIVSTPVINHPEVAIVGVNRMAERPMLRGGQVVGRLLMNLSSSFDHRVVDGMHAAQFIQAMRALLETPALLFVE